MCKEISYGLFFYLLHWKFAEYFVYYLYKKLTIG